MWLMSRIQLLSWNIYIGALVRMQISETRSGVHGPCSTRSESLAVWILSMHAWDDYGPPKGQC